jgi:DNA-directed RNA polymerase specialized sigma24 family protein
MNIIYEFADGATSTVEVAGELAAEFCAAAGIGSANQPEELKISDIEKRADRKHGRPHKYSGLPVSIEEMAGCGAEAADSRDYFGEAEAAIIAEQMLAALTGLQRRCFAEVCLNGRTQQSVADELGVAQQVVGRHIKAAQKKLQKILSGRV